jgi:hypothetical protein
VWVSPEFFPNSLRRFGLTPLSPAVVTRRDHSLEKWRSMLTTPPIRRREICPGDIDRVVDLLTTGFRMHKRERPFWERAMARLSEHRTPPGYPKYGYLLDNDGTAVGVTLMVYSTIIVDGQQHIRCSMSSWYVQPAFRAYGSLLTSRVFQQKEVTFFNITPDPSIFPVLSAVGYKRYCSGRFLAVPALSASLRGVRVRTAAPDMSADGDLSAFETQLLLDYRRYGCICVTCSAADGRHPFVSQPRRKAGLVPFALLVYCRHLQDFARLAGPLGRYLAVRGILLVVADADGPIAGFIGRYCDGFPKYFRGPEQPRLGDLAYSERALFGF